MVLEGSHSSPLYEEGGGDASENSSHWENSFGVFIDRNSPQNTDISDQVGMRKDCISCPI